MAKKKVKKKKSEATFEDSLEELESIVERLESGELGLSEALAMYEQGVAHLKSCQELLETAERRIELLSGVDAQGNPVSTPMDDESTASLDQKAASRSRRRSQKAGQGDVDDRGSLF